MSPLIRFGQAPPPTHIVPAVLLVRVQHSRNGMCKVEEGPSTRPTFAGAAVAEWLSSWLAEQEDRGSIPRLAT